MVHNIKNKYIHAFLVSVTFFSNMYPLLAQPGENLWHLLATINTDISILALCSPTPITEFPTTISQPGVYCLNTDVAIDSSSQAAIFIASSNVYIDLNGHSISNPSLNGIEMDFNSSRIVIQNGFINNCIQGIILDANNDAVLMRNIRMCDCAIGITGNASSNIIASDIQVYEFDDFGIVFENSFDITIKNCIAAQETTEGIGHGFSISSSITSLVNSAQLPGILIQDCQSSNVQKGFVVGLTLNTTVSANLINCISQGNNTYGFDLGPSINALACKNCIASNNNVGFNINCSSALIENCVSNANKSHGFTCASAIMKNTLLDGCNAHSNGGNGFNFSSTDVQNVLNNCTATHNNIGFSTPITNNILTLLSSSVFNNTQNFTTLGSQSARIAVISAGNAEYAYNLRDSSVS